MQIDLGKFEQVIELSGSFNIHNGITSLKLVTNERTWGPWGVGDIKPFTITPPTGTTIVGFFARQEGRLNAIGVYFNKE